MTCYFDIRDILPLRVVQVTASRAVFSTYITQLNHVHRQGAVQARATLAGLESVSGAVQSHQAPGQEPCRVCDFSKYISC